MSGVATVSGLPEPFGQPIEVISAAQWQANKAQYCNWPEPYVVRGLANDWPVLRCQQHPEDGRSALDYVKTFCQQAQVDVLRAPLASNGRIFYNDDFSGFNFQRSREALADVLATLHTGVLEEHLYVGSSSVDQCLPGFRNHNNVTLPEDAPLVSVWLGNQSRVAAHFDAPDNLAVVLAGTRRFTLFAPEQAANLYVGPLDKTPAGQAISLVDFHQPDLSRFPNFKQAMAQAHWADLQPGDAIYIPGLWWHHVEGASDINVLMNYWWMNGPTHLGSGMDVLLHGVLSLRQMPQRQRQAWQALFAHFVFGDKQVAHIPEQAHGILGNLSDDQARQLRAMISNRLRR